MLRTSTACNDSRGNLGDVTFARFSRALLFADSVRSLSLSLSSFRLHSNAHAFLQIYRNEESSLRVHVDVSITKAPRAYLFFFLAFLKIMCRFSFLSSCFLLPSARLTAPTLPFIHSVGAFNARVRLLGRLRVHSCVIDTSLRDWYKRISLDSRETRIIPFRVFRTRQLLPKFSLVISYFLRTIIIFEDSRIKIHLLSSIEL